MFCKFMPRQAQPAATASVRSLLTASRQSVCGTMPLEAVTAVTASSGMVQHADSAEPVSLTDAACSLVPGLALPLSLTMSRL
ncbi:TPA: hypothetical protein ACH3X3_005357 [Trebouxia sp. C0006]